MGKQVTFEDVQSSTPVLPETNISPNAAPPVAGASAAGRQPRMPWRPSCLGRAELRFLRHDVSKLRCEGGAVAVAIR